MSRIPIDTKRNRYCGPYAVAHILGLPSSADGARMIREANGYKRVRGASNGAVHAAITWGSGPDTIEENPFIYKSKRPTLAQFLKGRRGGLYLINVTHHYIVVDGNKIYDNAHPNGVRRRDWPHRRKRVQAWWRFR